jgi:hypothetical protein
MAGRLAAVWGEANARYLASQRRAADFPSTAKPSTASWSATYRYRQRVSSISIIR